MRMPRCAPPRLTPRALAALLALTLLVAPACTDEEQPAASPSPALEATPTATITATPTSTPTPETTPTEVASTSTPAPDELRTQLAEVGEVVEELRGIPSDEMPEWHIVGPDEIREIVAANLEEEQAVDSTLEEQRLYRLLGLIEPDADLAQIYRDLLGDQVLGLYEPDTDRFFVRVDGTFDAAEETTYAHEYVHYLQDVRFDLAAMQEATGGDRDQSYALTSLVEGDAVRIQLQYMLDHVDRGQLLGLLLTSQPPTVDPPDVVLELLQFPYLGGAAFVRNVEDVRAAFESPPLTTEQALHPEKFAVREPALEVTLPDLDAALGSGWSTEDENSFGELFIRAWLGALGAPTSDARPAADGWGGDALTVLTGADDRLALGAFIAWDNPEQDAEEFVSTLAAALDEHEAFERDDLADDATPMLWRAPLGFLGLRETEQGVAIAAAPDRAAVAALLEAIAGGVAVG